MGSGLNRPASAPISPLLIMRCVRVLLLLAVACASCSLSCALAQPLPLPALPYAYDALAPFYTEAALRVHHLGHHQAYTDKLNAALLTLRSRGGAAKDLVKLGIDAILCDLASVPEDLRTGIRNNGGGYVNHDLYWKSMAPPPATATGQDAAESGSSAAATLVPRELPEGSAFAQALIKTFGSVDEFRSKFSDAAVGVFGSGWVYLYVHVDADTPKGQGQLRIRATGQQDNPAILDQNPAHVQLLTLDCWEHAYYVDYLNKRPVFIQKWWSVVNWKHAESAYQAYLDGTHTSGRRDEL